MRVTLILRLMPRCSSLWAPRFVPRGLAPSATPIGRPRTATRTACRRTDCSQRICAAQEQEVDSSCEMIPEYTCYAKAICERQLNGECGVTPSDDLSRCLETIARDATPLDRTDGRHSDGVQPICKRTGCAGQLCAAIDIGTLCDIKPEYACYEQARCELQAGGNCGFSSTPELDRCLAEQRDAAAERSGH